MDLSAVVVNWNSGVYLARLLHSLSPLQSELRESLIVDNASEDASLEAAADQPVELLCLGSNQGFAQAANQGIARTSASFVLLLNPDVEVKVESVRELYDIIRDRPQAAIVCGPLVGTDGDPQDAFQFRSLPDWKQVLIDVLFINVVRRWFDRPAAKGPSSAKVLAPDRAIEVEQPAAAFWILRKEVWEKLGGFDSRFHPAWFEDVDFCKRLSKTHWKILYCPVQALVHRGGLARHRLGYSAFVDIYYRNMLRYFKKHHPYPYLFLWFPVQFGRWFRKWFLAR